jgi:hypothetical protein
MGLFARDPRGERALQSVGRYFILAYAQAVVMLLGFPVLSVLGLA